jgi:hypothetical protein
MHLTDRPDGTGDYNDDQGRDSLSDKWILERVRAAVVGQDHLWQVTPALDEKRPWIYAEPPKANLPTQGWKLHLASFGSRAADTLDLALPVIVAHEVPFKVLGALAWLGRINRGSAGLSQVGKFITIYPRDEAEAVALGLALVTATRGLRGPEIPSDRAIETGSIVHYRYGAFGAVAMQTRLGEILPALCDPCGGLVPDQHSAVPHEPEWAADPFKVRGLGAPTRLRGRVGPYQPVWTLSHSPGVLVQLAIDTGSLRTCVLKRANLRGAGAFSAMDPGHRLRREADLLARLHDLGIVPELYDLVETAYELTLVTEDLSGDTIEEHVAALAAEGRHPSNESVVDHGIGLSEALAALHQSGTLHGDLKSANIIIGPDRRIRFVDLDLAHPIGSATRAPGAGTRGYMSLGCRAGAPAVPADDIYALGAVLYLLATGAEPSRAPDVHNLQAREPALLNPSIRPALAAVIGRCLANDPKARFDTASDVATALAACRENLAPPVRIPTPPRDPGLLLKQARRAADHICSTAEPSGAGLVWLSTHLMGNGLVGPDINTGVAGTVLALAELVDAFQHPLHRDTLRAGATSLSALQPLPGDQPAGLFVGEAGIVVALLRAGQVLDDAGLVTEALLRSLAGAARPMESPDLFHGAAGRLLAHLLVFDATRDPRMLTHATQLGDTLLLNREGGPSESYWRIPPGYGSLSGKSYLGYAHGAAGIADMLLELHEATGEPRFAEAARGTLAWLLRQAVPVCEDERGLGWPAVEGGRSHPPFWCHGATGIGRFLLHAAQLGLPGAQDVLPRVAHSVAHGARWSAPTLCHGLAGNIDLLLDIAYWLGDSCLRDEADQLLTLMDAYRIDTETGCAWISEAPRQISPDYLVGYAGIALICLRRAQAGRPPQLSRAGFRYRTPLPPV